MSTVQMRRILKPSAQALLTVPVGKDVVVWNLHRRYGMQRTMSVSWCGGNILHLLCDYHTGPIRLPLLLDGWFVVWKVSLQCAGALLT